LSQKDKKHGAKSTARPSDDARKKPEPREYVIDADDAQAEPAAEDTGTAAEREEISHSPDDGGATKVSRKALLERLFSKSEEIASVTKQNRELEAKAKELNDKWLRTAAEFENYRKRTAKEWELLRQQSKAEVILEILNVLDDFERAFTVAEGEKSDGFVEGFRLIYNNLTQTLERVGVKEFDALHEPFDPQYHMAVSQVEREDLEAGLVAEVVRKGYQLDGTVIRPAQVVVAK
jgi:molecular chaperone GrpE